MVAIPGSLISSISPVASLTTLRLMSRLIVEAAHPSSAAMEQIELPVTTEREISSRSANVSAILDLRRTAGLIPPVSAKMRCIDEWFRSNSWAMCWRESPFCQ